MNFKQNGTQKKEAQIEEYIFDLSIHIGTLIDCSYVGFEGLRMKIRYEYGDCSLIVIVTNLSQISP